MRLRGVAVGGLQRDEQVEDAVHRAGSRASPRSDLPVATPSVQPAPCSRASSAAMPSNSGSCTAPRSRAREERLLVGLRPTRACASGVSSGASRAIALGRLRPTMRRTCVRVGRGEAGLGEALGHRRADRRLAVAQRAVAVEHGEADGHSANRRISAAIAGEPCASSASATRSALLGRLVLRQLEGRPPGAHVHLEADDAAREPVPQLLRDFLGAPGLAGVDPRFLALADRVEQAVEPVVVQSAAPALRARARRSSRSAPGRGRHTSAG